MSPEKKENFKKIIKILGLVLLGTIIGVSYYFSVITYQKLLGDMTSGAVVTAHAFQEVSLEDKKTVTREVSSTVTSLPLGDIDGVLDRIYQLESSSGKNDSCHSRGLHNGYGYNTGQCFGSDEEAREASMWQLKRYADRGMDLNTMICYWNMGIVTDSCEYLNKFNSLTI